METERRHRDPVDDNHLKSAIKEAEENVESVRATEEANHEARVQEDWEPAEQIQ